MQYDLVTVVSSRRGIAALRHLLWELPASFSSPIACLVEASPGLVQELQSGSRLEVRWAERGMRIEKGNVYLSRPGESLICLADGTFGIVPCGAESSAMHPVDGFLESAANLHGKRLLSLVLSGFDHDGVEGCECVRERSGTVLVLDRATARYWGLAEPIVQAGAADRVLTIIEVAEALRGCFTSQDLLRCAEIQLQLADLLEAAMRLAGTRMGHVTRRVRDSDKLRIIVQRGLGVDYFERFEAMTTDADLAWCQAVRFRQRIVTPEALAVPLLVPRPQIEAHGAITALYPHQATLESRGLEQLAEQAAALVTQVS